MEQTQNLTRAQKFWQTTLKHADVEIHEYKTKHYVESLVTACTTQDGIKHLLKLPVGLFIFVQQPRIGCLTQSTEQPL
jgi:hypothetical protein